MRMIGQISGLQAWPKQLLRIINVSAGVGMITGLSDAGSLSADLATLIFTTVGQGSDQVASANLATLLSLFAGDSASVTTSADRTVKVGATVGQADVVLSALSAAFSSAIAITVSPQLMESIALSISTGVESDIGLAIHSTLLASPSFGVLAGLSSDEIASLSVALVVQTDVGMFILVQRVRDLCGASAGVAMLVYLASTALQTLPSACVSVAAQPSAAITEPIYPTASIVSADPIGSITKCVN